MNAWRIWMRYEIVIFINCEMSVKYGTEIWFLI